MPSYTNTNLVDLFIHPGQNVTQEHPDIRRFAQAKGTDLIERWSTERGQSILRELREHNFSRNVLDNSVGTLYGHYDLRGVPLQSTDLRSKDLSYIDFYRADLRNCNLTAAILDYSHLSEANVAGAKLDFAKLNGTLIDNIIFSNTTSLVGAKIDKINDFAGLHLIEQSRLQERIKELEYRSPYLSCFLRVTCDYGRSTTRWAMWAIAIIVAYGLLYFVIPESTNRTGLFDSIYFSVVTFTTLGFGDIIPQNVLGKLIVMSEVFLGYVMGGILIAILSRRMLPY